MASKFINVTLKVWRQKNADSKGNIETYQLAKVSTDSSFLEMLDQLNEQLINEKQAPVAFDHDCREGFVALVLYTLTGELMVHKRKPRLASYTCVVLMMGTPFILSHGGLKLFLSSRI